jgi:hypothetical protein
MVMENPMIKSIVGGTIALVIVASTVVYAQQRPGSRLDHWRPSPEEVAVFNDARIAALKAVLKLSPAQERYWPAIETAIRDLFKDRVQRRTAMREPGTGDLLERLRRRADLMAGTAAGLQKFIGASEPLYQSLDEAQKQRLRSLMRVLSARHSAVAREIGDRDVAEVGAWHRRSADRGPRRAETGLNP